MKSSDLASELFCCPRNDGILCIADARRWLDAEPPRRTQDGTRDLL